MTEFIQKSYAILKFEVMPTEESEMWFSAAEESKAFHCQSCGKFLFYRQHRIIAMVQDDMSHVFRSPPLSIQCRKCNHLYKIHIQ